IGLANRGERKADCCRVEAPSGSPNFRRCRGATAVDYPLYSSRGGRLGPTASWATKSGDYCWRREKTDFVDSRSLRAEKPVRYGLNPTFEARSNFQCLRGETRSDFPPDSISEGWSTAKPILEEWPTGYCINSGSSGSSSARCSQAEKPIDSYPNPVLPA